MSIDPSTGPRTEAGKTRSSLNATKHGLFAARDFIREGEEEEYAQTLTSLMEEIAPEGILEQTFATEIMGATWRLRRCRLVEEAFSCIDELDFDPMVDENTAKQQRSVDRARAQSHLILRRSLAEMAKLRKAVPQPAAPANLKTEDIRAIAKADFDAMMAAAERKVAQQNRDKGLSSFCKPGESLPAALMPEGSFCKTTPQTPRNAQCPCGSGVKFKRCCGKNAPPVLNLAA